jgi:hypothetical protein
VRTVLAVVPAMGAGAAEQVQDDQCYNDNDNDADDAHFVSLGDGLHSVFPDFPEVRRPFRLTATDAPRMRVLESRNQHFIQVTRNPESALLSG